jgi:hypothetical protein
MEAKDFYFELSKQVSGYFFLITPKAYYDREGCLSDESGIADAVLPKGFYELTESTYEYEGTSEAGREILLSIGMKEISFGFQPGEPSAEVDDEDDDEDDEFHPRDEEGEQEEDELDMLLKEDTSNEPHPFDYKNVSTDKLLRHLKMMLETDSFEEAAKIRDELTSRNVTIT